MLLVNTHRWFSDHSQAPAIKSTSRSRRKRFVVGCCSLCARWWARLKIPQEKANFILQLCIRTHWQDIEVVAPEIQQRNRSFKLRLRRQSARKKIRARQLPLFGREKLLWSILKVRTSVNGLPGEQLGFSILTTVDSDSYNNNLLHS